MTSLIDAALAIAATGLPVFPCVLNGTDKQPVCAGGHKAATSDPARIRSLFSHSAANIIGMPTGEPSGIVVIDLDPRHEGDAWFEANKERIPRTRTHRTLQGGRHLLFNDGGHGIRNSAGKIKDGRRQGIAPGVDVRGNGGWIVYPPSQGYTVQDGAPIADLPEWMIALCRKAPQDAPVAAHAPQVRPWQGKTSAGARPWSKPPGEATPYGAAALQSACDEIRNASDGSKADTINRVAYSIGGLVPHEIPAAEAWSGLSSALAEIIHLCKDKRKAEKMLERAFNEGKARSRDVPERVIVETGPDPLIAGFVSQFADQNAILQRAVTAKPLAVSTDLMNVDGALKLFVDYCLETAISPQPFLALAAGITAIGALAGRKYRTKTNLRTNVYTIGVCDSGGGKDHARQKIKDVFAAGNLTPYIGGEHLASGTAMMTALGRHPCVLFQIDEFGDFLENVLGKKASPHTKDIARNLKTLYSSAGSFISGTEYADQSKVGRPREDIQQPHACLHGTTTPGQFWRAIADASLEDGLLARCFIFVSPESYPDPRQPEIIALPAALVSAFKAVAEGPANSGTGELGGLMLANTVPEPLLVLMTDDADAAYKDLQGQQLARQRKHAGTYVTAIAGRLAENATKLALIRAVSRDPRYPVIQACDMAWGRALAEHCIDTLLREADDNVADTQFGRNVQKTKKLIRSIGPCTKRDMQRKNWHFPDREGEEILRMLVESEQVIATIKEGGTGKGRPAIKYSIGPR